MPTYRLFRTIPGIVAITLLGALSLPAHAQTTAPAPARVNLTGIVGLVKPARALLEVEQAGQPPQRLSLREGEQAAGIELLSVDAAKNRVRIRNGGVEQELNFVGSRVQVTTPSPVADTTTWRTWDAATGKPLVEPHRPPHPPSQPPSAPIIVGVTENRAAPSRSPRVPDVTVIGRRDRAPIQSMLGPRLAGPGHGGFGDAVPPVPMRTPRADEGVAVPQEPQFPDLALPPQPGQPTTDPAELPLRRLRELQIAEQIPPPPAPADAPAFPTPGVGYQLPLNRPLPGYGGGYMGDTLRGAEAVTIWPPFQEGYGGYLSPGARQLRPQPR